jgi:hypothetical protein
VDVPAKHAECDRVRVLVGREWHPAVVVLVGRWGHWSGQTWPVYTVRFANGVQMACGNNSTRA